MACADWLAEEAILAGFKNVQVIKNSVDPELWKTVGEGNVLRRPDSSLFVCRDLRDTNKVNDDARHLIAGIEHGRDAGGGWTFTRWELIDLSHFRVKLKAEFEGSNRDMYKPEAVVGAGPK